MKHITDIPQAAQGMGLFDLILMIALGGIVGLVIGSLIASWLMAVVCRTVLRHQATVGSCFSAYWLAVLASFGCAILLGIWQAVVFFGLKGEQHALLPLWNLAVFGLLASIVSIMIYGLKIKDTGARHLGIGRATALFFVQPLVLAGLVAFMVWAIDAVWKLRGLEPFGAVDWLRAQIEQRSAL